MRKLLYTRDSACVQPMRALVERQSHKALVLWALECADPYLSRFEKNMPNDDRPRVALETARLWARGQVKMPMAKKAIHAAHRAGAAVGDATRRHASIMAAARAIGHAAATVHVETHALGLVFYGLTSQCYAVEEERARDVAGDELDRLYDRLLYWEAHAKRDEGPWADFLAVDVFPNKEAILRRKTQDNDLASQL